MKIITSIDEWVEAAKSGRLLHNNENGWVASSHSGHPSPNPDLRFLQREISDRNYAIAPEEVKLVEYKYRDTLYYLSQECERPPVLWKATGRTLTGVIDSE